MRFIVWLALVGGTVVGAVPPNRTQGYDGIVTQVTGTRVRLRLLTVPSAAESIFTVLKASGKEAVGHVRLLTIDGDQAEGKILKRTGIITAGDWVVAGEKELVTAAGPLVTELPQITEREPLAPAQLAARLDLPSALPWFPSLFGEITGRAAEASGREFRSTERILHASPSRNWQAWVGMQQLRLRGRDRRNRFETDCLRFGVRYLLSQRSGDEGIALSYERFRPDDGTVTTPTATATMKGPKGQTLSLVQGRRGRRMTRYLGLSYSRVRIPTDRAWVVGAGAGLDIPADQNWVWQSNASFFYTRWRGATITNWVLMSAFAYFPAPWARMEVSIGYAPRGFPLAGHSLTGLSSFLLHRPGGLVRDFTRSPGGFFSARLVVGTTF